MQKGLFLTCCYRLFFRKLMVVLVLLFDENSWIYTFSHRIYRQQLPDCLKKTKCEI